MSRTPDSPYRYDLKKQRYGLYRSKSALNIWMGLRNKVSETRTGVNALAREITPSTRSHFVTRKFGANHLEQLTTNAFSIQMLIITENGDVV
ncbi:hypothetical protein SAMN04488112_101148 [Melghirimyces thermohalophilus]|uniref:Uncharacterized protein n=1 Tax=Melghirimyces thermohalophilus TaxID=1236220 RepID=A0A1G6HPS3_9BACL|nr:hypothetical protein SAMN04488112_101148 [Melghirimyces thermohalophilus]